MNLDLQNQSQLYLGLWEAETNFWMRRLSRGIKSAVDIGAAHGEQTLYFLLRTDARIVFAIEPEESNRTAILGNLRLNGAHLEERLRLIPKFMGVKNNDLEISLDALFSEPPLSPCFIKMDIEGSETLALSGAKSILKAPFVRWLIETHSKKLESDCLTLFATEGYRTKVIHNAWWRRLIPEERVNETNRWLVAYRDEVFL